jgi:hypothetical protein
MPDVHARGEQRETRLSGRYPVRVPLPTGSAVSLMIGWLDGQTMVLYKQGSDHNTTAARAARSGRF